MPHLSDSVVDNAEYQDDYVELAGQRLLVRSPIRAGMISEFSTGIKIGKATYDEREHAFWVVLDDFSGGFGHRELDIREAGGTHWDNPGGVDLRRPRHITLPGLRTLTNADFDATAAVETDMPFHPTMVFSSLGAAYLQMGLGNSIFTMNNAGAVTRRRIHPTAGSNRCLSLVDFRGSDGTRRLYAFFGRESTAGYQVSTDGVVWTNGSALPGQSGTIIVMSTIKWDAQIVAFVRRNSDSREGITASADGANWLCDGASGYFNWEPLGDINWCGVAMAPWGASAPYFIDPEDGTLYVLDFYNRNAIPIEGLGDNQHLRRGTVWNGMLAVTDTRRVWLYEPASGGTIRDIGPFATRQLPPSWSDGNYRIVQLLSGAKDLFALCYRGDASVIVAANWRIAVYNEAGWSWFGPEYPGVPWAAIIGTLTTWSSGATVRRNIHVIDHEAAADLDTRLHTIRLPEVGDVAYSATNEAFEDGPLRFETGWFDGGFSELEGALLRMDFDGYRLTSTETVQVEYRLNNNEDADWTNLGTFTTNQQEIWFGGPRVGHRGIAFKTVQFRVSLDRGTTTSRTPVLRALILLFDKKPKVRTSWTLQIDVSKMVERGIRVSGRQATYERVWQFIKTLVNTPTLLELKVPSLESGGVNVRITDMPASAEDFRPARGGRGVIDLQLIEVAGG